MDTLCVVRISLLGICLADGVSLELHSIRSFLFVVVVVVLGTPSSYLLVFDVGYLFNTVSTSI